MTGLEELRSTLREHADAVADTGLAARSDAVHRRVRVARRRRRSAVAIAAAVLVGGTALTTQVLERRDVDAGPADTVLGQQLPSDIRIDGVRYHLTDTERLTPGREVQLIGDIGDPVVQTYSTLVTEGLTSGDVTLKVDDDPVSRLWGDGAAPPVATYRGATVSVTGPDDARVALATYTPTDDVGPGVTSGEVTFRQHIGTRELLAAAFSQLDGRPTASVDVPAVDGTVWLAMSCQAQDPDERLYVRVVGDDSGTQGECSQSDDALPTASAGFELPEGDTFRVILSRTENGPAITDPGVAVVGLAAYRSTSQRAAVPGPDVDETVTRDSRIWKLVGQLTGRAALEGLTIVTPPGPDEDRLIGVASGRGQLDGPQKTVQLVWSGPGQKGEGSLVGTGGVTLGEAVILSGSQISVRLRGDGEGTILVYRPVGSAIE